MSAASTLKHFKSGNYNYLYVYFKYKGNILRINTKQKYTEGMHKQDLFYSAKHPRHEILNMQLKNLKSQVDQYIAYKMQFWGESVSQKECQQYIKTGEHNIQDKQFQPDPNANRKNLLQHYDDFLLQKQNQFNGSESIKDYKSLGVALQKYQDTYTNVLTFESINTEDFFNRFRNYLGNNHNSNTTSKRISNLKTFMVWIEKQEFYNFKGFLYKYKVETYKPKYVTLVKQLYDDNG